MERICNGIYIDNSKMLLIRLDLDGEALFTKGDGSFINFIDKQIALYQNINYIENILAIMPTTATKAEFILSNKCNMGCIYCYSSINRNDNSLDFNQAAVVIDRLITNAVIKNLKIERERKIYLSFHGGGEPSCEFNLLKNIVEYAKNATNKSHTKLFLEITTNLSQQNDDILNFYLDNDFFIHVSMDGTENVQNYQRPYADGSNSFATVKQNLSYLSKYNALFSIRLTVTDFSIAYIVDSIKHLKETYPNIRFIKLAPLEISETSQLNAIKPPKLTEYIKVLEKIDSLLWNKDSNYISILGESDILINSGMCASVRFEQMIISPEGMITSCHEDPLSKNFIYGFISDDEHLKIDTEKIKFLKKDRLENITKGICSKCVFRLLCMGGCKHRMQSISSNMFCSIEKYTLIKHIKNAFNSTNSNYKCRQIEYFSHENKSVVEIISLEDIQ